MAERIEPSRLHCPKCASVYQVEVVLDHCDVSWPNQGDIEPGRLTLGEIDGEWNVKGKR